MIVHQESAEFTLDAGFDAANLAATVAKAVQRSGVRKGVVTLFNRGSTAGLTTIEFESGCLKDLRRALEQIAPSSGEYAHNERWGDGNGFSHLRAALIGPSLSAPVTEGRAGFTTWQQPILINFDNHRRTRTVDITVIGTA